MYPYLRLAYHVARARRLPKLGLFDTHVSHHLCWPQDIDPWVELNNGRTLTLYDLGRLPLFQRNGVVEMMRKHRWGGTVAGSSVRYRRRVRMGQRVEMRSRLLGWDDRFVYVSQSLWRGGDCTSQALIRTAVVDADGLVPTPRLEAVAGQPSPALPGWVTAWAEAEARRTWPPED
jgi:acyl-CoA thioesterase FadM